MPTKVLIFDFDGTIVESNGIKDRAWFDVFPFRSERALEIIRQKSKGSRQTRYQIAREIIVGLIGLGEMKVDDIENEVAIRCAKFGELVEEGIVEGQGVEGAYAMLEHLRDSGYVLYLLTGTPLLPQLKVVERLAATGKMVSFKGIYGRVDDMDEKVFKKNSLYEIIKKEGVTKDEVMLVGDGKNEMAVALEEGCAFVGVANESNNWTKNERFPVITNLHELKNFVRQ